jgi:hypothetical protein
VRADRDTEGNPSVRAQMTADPHLKAPRAIASPQISPRRRQGMVTRVRASQAHF